MFNGYDALLKDKKALERCLYAQKLLANSKEIQKHQELKRHQMALRETLLVQREEQLRKNGQEEA